jgi:Restriction endonuclease/TIR domain
MTPTVFMIYSETDASAAALIKRSLDHRLPTRRVESGPYADATTPSIPEVRGTSDILIVLFSHASQTSRWAETEAAEELAQEGRRRGIEIIPVLLEPCEIPPALQGSHVVDLSSDGALGVDRLITHIGREQLVDFASLTPSRFESLVSDLLRSEGYDVTDVRVAGDRGAGLVIAKDGVLWAVEVKHYSNGRPSVSVVNQVAAFIAAHHSHPNGLLVTNSRLTSVTQSYLRQLEERHGIHIEVIEEDDLKRRVLPHDDLVKRYFSLVSKAE